MEAMQTDELNEFQRRVGFGISALLIALAFIVLYCPPSKATIETDHSGTIAKTVKETQDSTTPFLALFLSGITVLAFTLNGLRFSKISAGGVTAETAKAGEAAQGFYETPKEERAEEEITIDDKESPEPSESPISYTDQADGRYAVYDLEALPASVIGDALANWPDENKPDDLGSFEFATRKTGKGNHPWTVKFKGKKAITVSYGGQGKTEATVTA
jgi:hypothetical protein